MPRSTSTLTVSAEEQRQIEQWLAALGTPQQVAMRCRVLLALAQGESESAVAWKLGINRKTVRLWRKRFLDQGLNSLWEIAAGRGRKPTYGPEHIKAVIDATLQSKPKGNTHWSCRLMAASQGMSKSTVNNLWRTHNIKPHQTKTFKLSRDPKFLEKLTDVVGLYLNPPDKAIVLCVDEKSQIQALNRTQPGLPLKKGRCGTMTHDYKRNGTTTLFAALDLLAGKVIGDFQKRHRHQEFLKFLRRIQREFPGDTALHLVMDNYGSHGHAEVKAWLDKHPRFTIHYIPTSCSWLNLIERWFAELTNKRIRRDSFFSVKDLELAIREFLAAWNENPRPFVWTATVESIVAKLARCRQTLEQIKPGCTEPKSRKRLSS
ncbi:MAG TPA: IS630 family transposase [Gammaproteobacteria bacterium]|nr:IS630 family transposase [Gammaproteobacteria bacterium]